MSRKKKQTEEKLLNEVTSSEYKYGFTTDIESEIKSLKEREDLDKTNKNYPLKSKLKELAKYIKEIEKHKTLLNEKTDFSGLNGCDLIWRYLNLKQKLSAQKNIDVKFDPIINANHFYKGKEKILVSVIKNYLIDKVTVL